ncbi:MAG: class I SAM-dependent methyltransferase [Thermodesulfobacteriota bacterium]|nr:class I SAM-dependent methyltransferase [Thermodesulfobacteriota bacterium]
MPKTGPFDHYSNEYEDWFIINKYAFQSELNAIKKAFPDTGNGVEIGIGSGIFAEPLGIKEGIDPSEAMRKKARRRDIRVMDAVAEKLPYADQSKDVVLMVTTICFVDDIYKSFQEVHRVLKENGHFIIGYVDKNSPIGKFYLEQKNKSLFYKDAIFFETEELYEILGETGFKITNTYQTVFGKINEIDEVQNVLGGYGKGSFVVIKAQKMIT